METKDISEEIKKSINVDDLIRREVANRLIQSAKQNPEAKTQIAREAQKAYFVEGIEVNNGIYLYFKGMEYPERGFVRSEDIYLLNIFKRLIMTVAKYLPLFIPQIIIFILLPNRKKILNKLFEIHNDIGLKTISTVILKRENLTPIGQELLTFFKVFLTQIGVEEEKAEIASILWAETINDDNAYKYRLLDLMNEVNNQDLINNPKKEIKRILRLYHEREYVLEPVRWKVKAFERILFTLMLVPSLKKAIKNAILAVDLDRMKPDKVDKFWMAIRENYNYFGKDQKQRLYDIRHLKRVKPTKL